MNTYAQAAEILGTSRQRAYQMVSLVTRLPDEIREFVLRNQDPVVARFFTERRLRPLTQIVGDDPQMECFRDLLAVCAASFGVTKEDTPKS